MAVDAEEDDDEDEDDEVCETVNETDDEAEEEVEVEDEPAVAPRFGATLVGMRIAGAVDAIARRLIM